MVDIHCHILPGVDDGATSLEQAVEMVEVARAAGTTDIVATPHSNSQYHFDPDVVRQKIAELESATKGVIRIHTGCDFHLSASNIRDALAHPSKYTINHLNYLLVEFSDLLIPPNTSEIFERFQSEGIVPIITHPERNARLHDQPGQIRTWVENDCLVQVTGQSLLGRFGKRAKAFADSLMSEGLTHFVASDAHDPKGRPPSLAEAYRYVADRYGAQQAQALFVTNPRAALAGEPVESSGLKPRKRKWYQL